MTRIVQVAEAEAKWSEILDDVVAGEEVIIARGDVPIARLSPEPDKTDGHATLAAMRARRRRYGRTTPEEVRDWIAEGRA